MQSSVLFLIFKIWIMPAKWNPFAWKELIGTKRFDVQLSWWFLDIMTLTIILFSKFKFLFVFLFWFYYYYYLLNILRLFFVFHTLFPGMSHINVHPVQLIMAFGQNSVTTIDYQKLYLLLKILMKYFKCGCSDSINKWLFLSY